MSSVFPNGADGRIEISPYSAIFGGEDESVIMKEKNICRVSGRYHRNSEYFSRFCLDEKELTTAFQLMYDKKAIDFMSGNVFDKAVEN